MRPEDERGVSRRDFVAAAVAIGGSSALSACLDIEASTDTDAPTGTETPTATDADGPNFPTGTDPADLPAGQYVHLHRNGTVETFVEFDG